MRPVLLAAALALVPVATLGAAGAAPEQEAGAPAAPKFDTSEAGVARGTLALKKARATFASLKTYRDRFVQKTVMEFEKPFPGFDGGPEVTGSLRVSRPGRFACESEQFSVFSDAQTTTIHIPQMGQYRVLEQPLTPELLDEDEMVAGVPHPCWQAVIRADKGPEYLLEGIDSIKGSRPEQFQGRNGTRVLVAIKSPMIPTELSVPAEIWIDEPTGLIGEVVTDYTEVYRSQMQQAGGEDGPAGAIKAFRFELRIENPELNAEIASDAFTFKPGEQDKKVDEFDFGGGPSGPSPDSLLGDPAPEITGSTTEGKPFALSELKGRVVVLDFWATWCGPCMQGIPHVQDLAEKFKDKPVSVVGINQDGPGMDDEIKQVLADKKITFTQVLGAESAGTDYLVSAIPHMVLINKEGKIAFSLTGFSASGEKKMAANIEKLLAGEPVYSQEELDRRKKAAQAGSGDSEPAERTDSTPAMSEDHPERLVALEPLKTGGGSFMPPISGPVIFDTDSDGKPECISPQMPPALAIIKSDGSSVRTLRLKSLGASSRITAVKALHVDKQLRFLVASDVFADDSGPSTRVSFYTGEGDLLWQYTPELAEGHTCTVIPEAADLAGDAAPEIVLGISTYRNDDQGFDPSSMSGYIAVLSADGELQALRKTGHVQFLFIATTSAGAHPPIIIDTAESFERYTFDPAAQPAAE